MDNDNAGELRRCERLYDFMQANNQVRLPEPVIKKVLELIRQDNVRSVSCPFDDPELWRELVAEQVRRSKQSQLSPQEAFALFGPDGGLWDTPVEEWGGYVHIPYEGLCGGDLLLLPEWRKFFAKDAEESEQLSSAVRKCCYYLLSPRDFGELNCATRTSVGEWVLYQAKAHYVPCNPLRDE